MKTIGIIVYITLSVLVLYAIVMCCFEIRNKKKLWM